jgi:arylsulfatase A-like enzyme
MWRHRLWSFAFPLLVFIPLSVGCSHSSRGPAQAARPSVAAACREANLVICVLDAARPDHFGCYGYPRQTTPNIDALAEESLTFSRHYCQAPFTHASTASLFTSQYSDTHLVYGSRPLPDDAFTLAGALRDAGFSTALFSSIPWASPALGVAPGFQDCFGFEEATEVAQPGETWRSPETLLRLLGTWLDAHRDDRFFVYVHFSPPHFPYDAPEQHRALFEGQLPPDYTPETYRPGEYDFAVTGCRSDIPPLPEWIDLYDANLRYGDWGVGELLRMLRDSELLDDSIVIVTADHGEAFGEHGYVLHEGCPYEEALRIPLLIRFPQAARKGAVAALTQTIDVMPTVLDAFGVSYEGQHTEGRSLLALINGETDSVNEYVFSRTPRDPYTKSDGVKYTVRSEHHALILYQNGKWRALYDMREDSRQTKNVVEQQPDQADELVDVFSSFATTQVRDIRNFLDPSVPMGPVPQGDVERVRQLQQELGRRNRELRALGYLK